MRRIGVSIAALLVAAAIPGGGCGGTNTGNPGTPSASTSTNTAASDVLGAICAKLTACYSSLSASQCDSGIRPVTTIAPALGLASNFGSYQAILNAESAGTITPHASARTQCVSDIQALGCSSAPVQTAYSAGAPNDFSNVVNLIPTGVSSCKGLY